MLQNVISVVSNWFLSQPRTIKRVISVIADFFTTIFALWLAFSLRYGEVYLPPESQVWIFWLAPIVAIPIFIKFGLYRAIVRYLGMQAILTVVKATALYTLVFAVIILLVGVEQVPRTVYGINALILMLFIGGSRLIARWWVINNLGRTGLGKISKRYIPPVIIYGAGASGAQLVVALKMTRQLRPVAFVDDEVSLHRQQIHGLTVYSFNQLNFLIQKYDVYDILLAMPSISRNKHHQIIRDLEAYPLHVRSLPSLEELVEGKVTVSDIQEVDITDLLGRDSVVPVQDLLHRNITGKVVMVTGAGGSIGSELCRQIFKLEPAALVLYELSEFSLYTIEKELIQHNHAITIHAVLGSVLNRQRLEAVCKRFKVQTIYHAAAYKHVPMVEKNTSEGVRNNIFGTLNCAEAAIASDVDTFVLISTDKAVRPTNTMGASKRFAELVLQALSEDKNKNPHTRFTMVRFGNVLESSGSVVPLFREQIAYGGPVTVTDARIIRYFMTIPEAAELVIQAGAMGIGGDVFVLDMGEPIRILDLAKRMIRLSGFVEKDESQPDGDIEIIYTGLRPGEKLYEELLIGDNVSGTQHQKIMRAEEAVIPWQKLQLILERLELANDADNCLEVRNILMEYIDGFKPQCEVEDWLI